MQIPGDATGGPRLGHDSRTLDLSVIVPTYNERAYLPLLLESLLAQEGAYPREIVVGDGESSDGTQDVARRYPRTRVVYGGDHPGKGRNLGVRVATSSTLLFLDADTILPPRFLARTYREFADRGLDGATVSLRCYDSRHPFDHFLYLCNNAIQKAMQFSSFAVGSGMCLYMRREAFGRMGGFDETVRYAEDIELIQRLVRAGGRWRVLRSSTVWVTARRFAKEGRLRMIRLFLGTGLHMALDDPDRSNRYHYTFGHSLQPAYGRLTRRFLRELPRTFRHPEVFGLGIGERRPAPAKAQPVERRGRLPGAEALTPEAEAIPAPVDR